MIYEIRKNPPAPTEPVCDQLFRTFKYRDKSIGDKFTIDLDVYNNVFYPTSTTNTLLRNLRTSLTSHPKTLLDLGCGCGVVSVVLGKISMSTAKIYASDLSESAVMNAKHNARKHGISLDCRRGSLFEPWNDMKFDLIFCDVPGIAESIARKTTWYPPGIPCDSGYDGTRGTLSVLDQAHEFLTPEGRLYFGVASLSSIEVIASQARKKFQCVEVLDEKWFPFSEELMNAIDDVKALANKGVISIEKRRSRWGWMLQPSSVSSPFKPIYPHFSTRGLASAISRDSTRCRN